MGVGVGVDVGGVACGRNARPGPHAEAVQYPSQARRPQQAPQPPRPRMHERCGRVAHEGLHLVVDAAPENSEEVLAQVVRYDLTLRRKNVLNAGQRIEMFITAWTVKRTTTQQKRKRKRSATATNKRTFSGTEQRAAASVMP